MNREDIHIISRHSNCTEKAIDTALKEKVYSDSESWKKFLQILFISLGVGFTVSGIIFFFAYNWADLHKFAKMGIIEVLIIATTGIVLFSKMNLNIKNIILTGASMLVGVLIAVFGQIYQTGANAYDFFLGWTLFISLWVVISNYPPLWLIYFILINTTFFLYSQQVASHWSEMFVINILFLFNSLILVSIHLLTHYKKKIKAPLWFTSTIGLACISISTIGIVIGIFENYETSFLILIIVALIAYSAGIIYGFKSKSGFYLSIIPFSVIIIISALLINISDDASMFFFICLFIVASVTLLIKGLIDIQKSGIMQSKINIKENIEYIAQLEGDTFKCNDIEIENEYLKLHDNKSSLAIKILSVLGGFLATLAFLGFLLIAGLYDSELGLIVTGILFIGAALWLNVVFNKLIIDTLSVTAYALGFFLIAFGQIEIGLGENTVSIIFIIISMLTIRITKAYILSFVSILIINGCFIFLIMENDFYNLIHIYNAFIFTLLTFLILNEAKLISSSKLLSKLYNPTRIALIISVLIGLVFVGQRGVFNFGIRNIWLSSIITIPLTIYLISIIIKIIGITKPKSLIIIYALSSLVLIPTALSPAISGSLLIVLLCFLVNYKVGLSIGVLSFIYFISQYYYDLNFTLLTKSIILFISGIAFLMLYVFTHKKLSSNEKI